MGDFFKNLVFSSIQSFFAKILEEIINTFSNVIVDIINASSNVLDYKFVKDGIIYAQGIALTYVVVKILFQVLQEYILYENGDPQGDPGYLVIRSAESILVIGSIPWICKQVFLFGTTVTKDVASLQGVDKTSLSTIILGKNIEDFSISIMFAVIVAIIFIVLVFIQTFARSAEFALLSVAGCILAVNLTSANRSKFKMWWNQLLVVAVSQAMQLFLLKASLYTLINDGSDISIALLKFIGWLWITYKSPSWAKQWTYGTGLGNVAGGITSQSISNIISKNFTAKA